MSHFSQPSGTIRIYVWISIHYSHNRKFTDLCNDHWEYKCSNPAHSSSESSVDWLIIFLFRDGAIFPHRPFKSWQETDQNSSCNFCVTISLILGVFLSQPKMLHDRTENDSQLESFVNGGRILPIKIQLYDI